MSSPTRKAQVLNVIQVSSGNFLEMYDFMVFGYFASAIGADVFPDRRPFRFFDVVADDLRRRVSHAADRRADFRSLY